MGSYIADNIIKEYKKKKRYIANKEWSETQKFIKENCVNCKNRNTDLCSITRNIEGKQQCVFKE